VKAEAELARFTNRGGWRKVWRIGKWVLLGLGVVALAAFLYARFKPSPSITQEGFTQAPEMKPLRGIEKVKVQPPQVIYVYPPAAVAAAVPLLAQEIAKNPESQTLASATLPESKNGYDAAAVMDKEGKTVILAKEKTSPLFQFRNDLTAGVRLGVGGISGAGVGASPAAGDVHIEWKFLRIKNGRIGWYNEAGTISSKVYGRTMISADFDLN
jgi:hypothetical protein